MIGGARGAGFFLAVLSAAAAAADLRVQQAYDEALRLYQKGEASQALALFLEVQREEAGYRQVNKYVTLCAKALKAREEEAARDAVVRQARELLDRRQAILKDLAQAVELSSDPAGGTAFFLPAAALFGPAGIVPLPAAGRALSLIKDYAATFRTPWFAVTYERGRGAPEEEARVNERRAVLLGFRFFRAAGVAPEHLVLRTREAGEELFRLEVSAVKPPDPPGARRVQGVLVHAARPRLDPAVDESLELDVMLLDSARIKRWSLQILDGEGRSFRKFSGAQDVFLSLFWDGRDEEGRPAPAGLYRAFLDAETWASERRTDSAALVVAGPLPPKGSARAARPPPPAPRSDERRWAQSIGFENGRSAPSGAQRLAVARVAELLRIYPRQKASVEGFADPAEPASARLARERAEAVAALLVKEHGVAPERLLTRAATPRPALEGESLRQVLVFFLE